MEKLVVQEIYSVVQYTDQVMVHTHDMPHGRPQYEMFCRMSGSARLQFLDKWYDLRVGTVGILPKLSQPMQYGAYIQEPGWGINLYFDAQEDSMSQAAVFDLQKYPQIQNLFSALLQTWIARRSGYYEKSMSILYDIFSRLAAVEASYSTSGDSLKIKPAMDYLSAHLLDRKLPAQKLAELCGLSYTHFKSLFIKCNGAPPVKYITALRMQYACELLRAGQMSIAQISSLLGYDNPYYFSRVFKKVFKVPPSRYPGE